MSIQTLIPEASIKGLDKRVIRWFSWSEEIQHDLVLIRPLSQFFEKNRFHYQLGCELGNGCSTVQWC